MNVAPVETWLQEHAGLEAATLGAGVVARAARDRIEALRCARVDDYLEILATSAEERHTLIDRVVVPETWFFRDRPAFDALGRYVVDTWAPAHPGATFHVLSLPCSTGEEPYSIAIGLALAGWPLARLRIDAVDISREHLNRAKAATYGRNSFRGDDTSFREAFFEPTGRDAWRVVEPLRKPVHFEQGNLLADDLASGRGLYDAIFCRNLLIYFDRPTQSRAIRALHKLLAPDGWIAVGPAEPVLLFDHGFSALKIPSSFLLRHTPKEPPPTRRHVDLPRWTAPKAPSKPAAKAPLAKVAKPVAPATETLDSIRALADGGRLHEARERGEALLQQGGPNAELLCLLAVVAEAAGDVVRAEELFRKTLYLEPRHAEALTHLALLAEKKGDLRAAKQLRQRAQKLGVKSEVGS